jgi:hypothetical protein
LAADGTRSHVERRVKAAEATIVQQIFTLCAEGSGMKRIAVALNDAAAPSPRAQQGRPNGWAPSSVREVLYRELIEEKSSTTGRRSAISGGKSAPMIDRPLSGCDGCVRTFGS